MIQRIQSVYLFIVVVISFSTPFLLPELQATDAEHFWGYHRAYYFGFFHGIAFLAAISIFLFKNRKRQMNFIRFDIILNIVLLGLLAYWLLNLPGVSLLSEKGIELIVPVVSIVFLLMAHKAIKRDDKLIKSVDRLR